MFFSTSSCKNGETYADQKKKEKNAIKKFLQDNPFGGPINVITESQFYANDSLTDTAKNEYVLFEDDGIYMQIVDKGNGKTFAEMSKEFADSTVSKIVLVRYLEYSILDGDTLYSYSNVFSAATVDKMLVTYSQRGLSFTASFTESMFDSYHQNKSHVVPKGWIKPLSYVRLSKSVNDVARIRIIIPHTSGSTDASNNVYPFYYELSYQLGR